MNKYITALLIVLATTGVEAQTYQSALKALLSENSIENLFTHQEFKELENNLMSVLKTLNQAKENDKTEPGLTKSHIYVGYLSAINIPVRKHKLTKYFSNVIIPSSHFDSSVFIRGPNQMC